MRSNSGELKRERRCVVASTPEAVASAGVAAPQLPPLGFATCVNGAGDAQEAAMSSSERCLVSTANSAGGPPVCDGGTPSGVGVGAAPLVSSVGGEPPLPSEDRMGSVAGVDAAAAADMRKNGSVEVAAASPGAGAASIALLAAGCAAPPPRRTALTAEVDRAPSGARIPGEGGSPFKRPDALAAVPGAAFALPEVLGRRAGPFLAAGTLAAGEGRAAGRLARPTGVDARLGVDAVARPGVAARVDARDAADAADAVERAEELEAVERLDAASAAPVGSSVREALGWGVALRVTPYPDDLTWESD